MSESERKDRDSGSGSDSDVLETFCLISFPYSTKKLSDVLGIEHSVKFLPRPQHTLARARAHTQRTLTRASNAAVALARSTELRPWDICIVTVNALEGRVVAVASTVK